MDGFIKARKISLLASSEEKENDWPARIDIALWWKCLSFNLKVPSWIIPVHEEIKYYGQHKKPYKHYIRRQYGFSLYLDDSAPCVHFYWGIQDDDSNLSDKTRYKSAVWFIPWLDARHVRHTLYTPDGSLYAEVAALGWEKSFEIAKQCPKTSFRIKDFDGQIVEATAQLEEREWRYGTGYFKWVEFFRKPIIKRSLDIRYSAEVGDDKGSWKGGTVGHGISIEDGESTESALSRFYSTPGYIFRDGKLAEYLGQDTIA